MRLFALSLAAAVWFAFPAQAEVTAAAPSAFIVTEAGDTTATPEQTWRALGQVGRWWSAEHSYSQDPAHHMTLDMRAGGCFCERWARGSVEHARVILVLEDEGVRTLRMQGALGPLQETGVSGILTVTIAPHAQGAHVELTYRVAGDAGLALDQVAAPVDHVLMEQFGRLIRYAETGVSH